MKKKNTKIQIIISIFILILIMIFIICKTSRSGNNEFQEDFIFFKFLNQEQKQKEKINKKTNKYEIKISKGEKKKESINLFKTIDKKTLVNEKVAPGTKGYFEIILISDIDTQYKIEIKKKNKKPKNLKFLIENGQEGKIRKKEPKKILVNWEWCYEINNEENKQDTQDGENIEKYNFEIIVTGK